MRKETYNIYCDESRVENPDSRKMVIGALIIPRAKKDRVVRDIRSIFRRHEFRHELKWTKVGSGYRDFYMELIGYFLSTEYLHFRGIVVDKSEVKFKEYHDGSLENAFYKFYYIMLKAKLLSFNEYYIFLDKKPSREKNVITALEKFLEFHIFKNNKECRIRHLQSYDSDDNVLIQFADFLTGMLGFACNCSENRPATGFKSEVAGFFRDCLRREDLCRTSPLSEEKFNVFVWKGDYEKG